MKNIGPVKMSEINYGQSGSNSGEVGEFFLGNNPSNLK